MKVLYISSLVTNKEKYDGERIKSSLIYDSLRKYVEVYAINLSIHKVINTFRIVLLSLLRKKKYNYIIISKDSHGADIIHKLLKISKYPNDRIVYFEIGPFLYDRILDGSIKKETFINDKLIVVETPSMKEELLSLGFKRVSVFPNFKPICMIPFIEQQYPKKTLRLVYLSRIEDQKGIYDLVNCLSQINKNEILFQLDIYGRPQTNDDLVRITEITNNYKYINYLGMLDVGSKDSYILLSKYDLHVFPTKYKEGFPGTLIDFFIAGVVTLSSSFARSHEILSSRDSIIYEQLNDSDLIDKLMFIYSNQSLLNNLRKNSYCKKELYSIESFEKFLQSLINSNFQVR